jgi:hypothetical protein
MRRLILLLSALTLLPCLAGCPSLPPEPPAQAAGGIDYAGWPLLTRKPIPVAAAGWMYCRAPGPDGEYTKQSKKYGPHFSPAIRVFANPAAEAHLRSGEAAQLPAGAVIVKEKLLDEKAAQPVAYAAMIKREAGYDPEHGDWEYLYHPSGGNVERGKLESCIACHAGQAKQDYLFRSYERAHEPRTK